MKYLIILTLLFVSASSFAQLHCRKTNKLVKCTFRDFVENYPIQKDIKLSNINKFCLEGKPKGMYLFMQASYYCTRGLDIDSAYNMLNSAKKLMSKGKWKAREFKLYGNPFLELYEDVSNCIRTRMKQERFNTISKKRNQEKRIEKKWGNFIDTTNLVDLFPIKDCNFPNFKSLPKGKNNDGYFVIDVYTCDEEIKIKDRLKSGYIGMRSIYNAFAIFIHNEILIDYATRLNKTNDELKSSVHITIEGHTDKIKAKSLYYKPNSFLIPQNTKYSYIEKDKTQRIYSRTEKTNNILKDTIYGNKELGLTRAFIANEVIEKQDITSNEIELKSIHHTKKEGYSFRKVSIIVRIDDFYVDLDVIKLKKQMDKMFPPNETIVLRKVNNETAFIKSASTVKK